MTANTPSPPAEEDEDTANAVSAPAAVSDDGISTAMAKEHDMNPKGHDVPHNVSDDVAPAAPFKLEIPSCTGEELLHEMQRERPDYQINRINFTMKIPGESEEIFTFTLTFTGSRPPSATTFVEGHLQSTVRGYTGILTDFKLASPSSTGSYAFECSRQRARDNVFVSVPLTQELTGVVITYFLRPVPPNTAANDATAAVPANSAPQEQMNVEFLYEYMRHFYKSDQIRKVEFTVPREPGTRHTDQSFSLEFNGLPSHDTFIGGKVTTHGFESRETTTETIVDFAWYRHDPKDVEDGKRQVAAFEYEMGKVTTHEDGTETESKRKKWIYRLPMTTGIKDVNRLLAFIALRTKLRK